MKFLYSFPAFRSFGICLLLWLGWGQLVAQTVSVSGYIPLENVTIELEGSAPGVPPFSLYSISNSNGNYTIEVPIGSSFSIRPSYDSNPLNGVSTYDLVLINKHMLGTELLNTPYKIIAADADHSGSITSADSLDIWKLILGIYQEFPSNSSWRFVRSGYVFPDPQNPFSPPFPETAVFENLTTDVSHVDFIPVKIGDVNGSAIEVGPLGGVSPFLGIKGTVHFDENNNCTYDSTEMPLQNWLVTARGTNGTFYGTTNSNGRYYLYFPPGSSGAFDVIITPPNTLWVPCQDTVPGVAVNETSVSNADFNVGAVAHCPALSVDLSTPFLRRCFTNTYHVQYCNQGSAAAENASVEIAFDPSLEVQGSSIPWSTVNGQTYTFPVGSVQPGECADFQVEVKVSCTAEIGQTHCSTAHIYPDSLCIPPDSLWDGANLVLSGECQGNEIVFTITNIGANMLQPVGYVVIEDIMIQMIGGTIQLDHLESETITLPANGSTWRLEVDQAAHHPGNVLVSASVEGCGVNGQGSASLGIIPLFPTNEAGPFEDEDCKQNIGAFDPNDKQGFPLGVGAQHFIPQGQEIEYMIRFQNTGTDTAFNIIVLDTLSAALDPATLRAGSSSHPYTYHLLGNGVIQFVFANVMLPDSNVNEAGSHGYVQFAIAPKADRPDGTVIENEAAIFFDFNAPVITNRTWHTLGSQFLSVSNVVFQPGLELDVFPNPAYATTTFSLKTIRPTTGILRLFDVRGRQVRTLDFDHNVFELPLDALPAGLYFFRLHENDGTPLAAGKIMLGDQ